MDPHFLEYYNRELNYIRKVGGEFAREHSKIAGRLGLNEFECADPYVERLLESFAFLSARVQLKIDAEFPRFTQHLFQMVFPHYLAPTPSMAIVEIKPSLNEGSLKTGVMIPRGTKLRSQVAKGEQTSCEYRTAHELSLWPIEIFKAQYLSDASAVANLGVAKHPKMKAGLRLCLRSTAGLKFSDLNLDRLSIFLRGGQTAVQIYEQLLGHVSMSMAQPCQKPVPPGYPLRISAPKPLGFENAQALLPCTARSFKGYRLLQEYFAFPERFLFVELNGLQPAVARCESNELELIFVLNRSNPQLVDAVDASHFNLFCTPAINLFPKSADRIHLTSSKEAYHIVPDRTRPMDFELYDITEVLGFGTSAEPEVTFFPFYKVRDQFGPRQHEAYYTIFREQRRLSSRQRRRGARSSYIGDEAYISLVDANEAPYKSSLKQLGLRLLCTNRDLPLQMPVGGGQTDFDLDTGAPVESIRCLEGPTKPLASKAHRNIAWRLISHLSLNYLSLVDQDPAQGAAALRQLLMLYCDSNEGTIHKQIEGVLSIGSKPIIRRIDSPGPITFGRGLELTIDFDLSAFGESGVFLLGTVLEQFFAGYVSINSFTETVIRTTEQGEIMRWPARIGIRPLI